MIRLGNTAVAQGEALYDTLKTSDLAAFEMLPPVVRDAVRNAPVNLAAEPLLSFFRDEEGETGLDCIERIDAILSEIKLAGGRA